MCIDGPVAWVLVGMFRVSLTDRGGLDREGIAPTGNKHRLDGLISILLIPRRALSGQATGFSRENSEMGLHGGGSDRLDQASLKQRVTIERLRVGPVDALVFKVHRDVGVTR